MRISLFYKWFKEGKINCSQEEISTLWKRCEKLSFYRSEDRNVINFYNNALKAVQENDVERIDRIVSRLNDYFEKGRNDKAHCHLWILG